MRVIVVGLGVQGHKRRRFAGARFRLLASIPQSGGGLPRHARRAARRVTMPRWSACRTPPKIELLDYLRRQRQARARREAAVWRTDEAMLARLRAACARKPASCCYTAYNHRFEPHFVRMRDLVASGALGSDLSLPHVLRQRHGAAGAQFGLARSGRRRARRSRLASARYRALLVRRYRRRVFDRLGRPLREPRPDHVVFAAPHGASAARIRNDAAELAQSLHLRHVRRERHRAYQFAVQMGPVRHSPIARACCRAAGRRSSR